MVFIRKVDIRDIKRRENLKPLEKKEEKYSSFDFED